jgi:hypothetical protein
MDAAAIPPNFTGRSGSVFYVNGTPSRKIVEWCERKLLVRFPDAATRHYCLGTGPRPLGPIDYLPDEPEQPAAATL